MMPLADIKATSANVHRTKNNEIKIRPADPQTTSFFKRDVSKIIGTLNEQLKKEKPIENHVFKVLMDSNIGQLSSVGQHLNYKYNLLVSRSFI